MRIRQAGAVAHQPAHLDIFARSIGGRQRVARRQQGQLHAPAEQERATGDEQRIGPLASERCEGGVYVAAGTGMADLKLQSHAGGGTLHLPQRGAGIPGIQKHGDPCRGGHKLTQELQRLSPPVPR